MANSTNNNVVVTHRIGKKASAAMLQGTVVDNQGAAGGATSVNIGIIATTLTAGDEIEIYPPNERRTGVSGAAVTANVELTSDAAGKLIDATPGTWVLALSCASTTGADEIFEIWTVSPYKKTA